MTSKSGEKKATEGRDEIPERWSAHRKAEIVLRLLRGEDLWEVSREIKVPTGEVPEGRARGVQDTATRVRSESED